MQKKIIIFLGILFLSATNIHAAEIIVTNKAELELALTSHSNDVITFNTDIEISSNIAINGIKTLKATNNSRLYRASGYTKTLLTITGSTLVMENMRLDGSSISTNKSSAIIVDGGTLVTKNITIENCFNNAASNSYGGALSMQNAATVHFKQETILKNNKVNGYGGAIYVNSASTLLIDNSTLNENTATKYGGGIYNVSGYLIINETTLSANRATSGGGAIAIRANDVFEENAGEYKSSTMLELNNSTISKNQSDSGGGIMGTGVIKINNSLIEENIGVDGGGLYLDNSFVNNPDSPVTIMLMKNSLVKGNVAQNFGAGLSSRKVISKIETSAFEGNRVINVGTTSTGTPYCGGALWNESTTANDVSGEVRGNVRLRNVEMFNNSASYGGAICNYGGEALLTLNDINIHHNKASIAGGAIVNGARISESTGADVIMNSGSITNNTASLGGAIYNADFRYVNATRKIDSPAKINFIVNGGTIHNNSALNQASYQGQGGGIYNAQGLGDHQTTYIDTGRMQVIINEPGALYNNTAEFSGADLFNDNSNVVVPETYSFTNPDPIPFYGWFEDNNEARFSDVTKSIIINDANNNEYMIKQNLPSPNLGNIANDVINIKAVWHNQSTEIKFSVIYDGNTNDDGQIPIDLNSPYNDQAIVSVLDKNTLVKTGYNFIGWSLDKTATQATYQANDTFTINTDVILYAIWQKQTDDNSNNTDDDKTSDVSNVTNDDEKSNNNNSNNQDSDDKQNNDKETPDSGSLTLAISIVSFILAILTSLSFIAIKNNHIVQ